VINSERSIYLQETEIRPNHYAMIVLLLTVLCMAFCWVLTELGIFRVDVTVMRIGASIPIFTALIPLVILKLRPEMKADPRVKYLIVSAAILVSLALNVLLNFHATMMLLYPIFFAMLYRSKKLGILATIGSMVSTAVSPVLGYVLGTWDIPLLQELILIGTGQEVVLDPVYAPVSLIPVIKILLYLVLPRILLVGCCSSLLFYVIRVGVAHVNNMILLHKMSHQDNLTGLYNQNYFKELLASPDSDRQVGIIFFDVNGLKTANDSRGHEYGDLLLRRCARSLLDVCEEDRVHAFRIGGDEFLLLLEDADDARIRAKLDQWEQVLARINRENQEDPVDYQGITCSMASGYVIGSFRELEQLVRQADAKMYRNKIAMKAQRAAETT